MCHSASPQPPSPLLDVQGLAVSLTWSHESRTERLHGMNPLVALGANTFPWRRRTNVGALLADCHPRGTQITASSDSVRANQRLREGGAESAGQDGSASKSQATWHNHRQFSSALRCCKQAAAGAVRCSWHVLAQLLTGQLQHPAHEGRCCRSAPPPSLPRRRNRARALLASLAPSQIGSRPRGSRLRRCS